MEQSGLARFDPSGGPGEGDRPPEEADAVAGGDPGSGEVVDPARSRFPATDETIDLGVVQVNYTVDDRGGEEEPIIHVFGRTGDGEPEHVRVYGFRPYFYAPSHEVTDEALADERLTGAEPGYRSIKGVELTRVFGRTPRDVGNIRDEFTHFEADILFPNRFLIDKGIRSGVRVPARRAEDGTLVVRHDEVVPIDLVTYPRLHVLDIEVDDRSGFPQDGEEPIICLTAHDSVLDEFVAWIYRSRDAEAALPSDLAGYDPLREGPSIEVRAFESEEAMLEDYLAYVETTDPDCFLGWNVDDFDAPYLLDRLDRLDPFTDHDLSIERLSRVEEVWRSDWQGPNIKGRVVFDLLYAYRRTQFSELDSYRLDAVAEVELGVGKERYAGDIGDLWERDPERLLEYNLRDVELCVEIDRKQEIVAFWNEVRTFVGCKLEDATTPGDAVDMYVLHKVHGEFVLPSKGDVDGEEYEGGAVFDPITGVRENVSVLDLKSLYPMCMMTVNASPETKVDEAFDGATFRAPNGTLFRKEPDGIIREMVDELLEEREQKKASRDEHEPDSDRYRTFDRQQAAIKVIMNSLYGTLGWSRFRLYDREMGAAVTATGREVIRFTDETVDELGYEVVYGDSVTGDRPVVVRDPDGMITIAPIEELFDRGRPLAAVTGRIAADGGSTVASAQRKDRRSLPGWEALSMNEDGRPEWRPITQLIRHETDKKVVRLQHKFGESTTTRDHSYIVEEDGEYVGAIPEDVTQPLRVPGLPNETVLDRIDVYDVLRGYTREFQDGRGVGRGNEVTKTKRVHADDEWVWFGAEHHSNLDGTIKVKRYIDLTGPDGEALVRLLGTYVAEGSASTIETTDSRFGASIAESRRAILEQLQRDYYRLFENTTANIIESDPSESRSITYESADGTATLRYSDSTLKLQMMNELAAVFFREFAGQTSRGKRVPSVVFHLPDRLQKLFLEAVIDGDGSRLFPRYSDDDAERHFDFETTSRELAAGISMLLIQRGRKHSLKYREEKGSYTIRTCDEYRQGRRPILTEAEHDGYVYDLSVEGNANFVDGVGGIVLHNTDSVLLELGPDVTKEEAIERSFEIEGRINDSYDDFAREVLDAGTHHFQIEFEKLYRRFFQAGKKKRYAGHAIWKEGKDVDDIDITGFEYKRSDIAPITKEVQRSVIEQIVTGEDPDAIKAYVASVIERFQSGDVELDEVGIPGGIGKRLDNYDTDTAHVRGAKYANLLLGTNFDRGSKPKRLYLAKVHPSYFRELEAERGFDPAEDMLYGEFKRNPDVICFEFADQIPEAFEIDWDKMLEKTLRGPIARVLEAIDISWDEVKSGQEQTGLESFM